MRKWCSYVTCFWTTALNDHYYGWVSPKKKKTQFCREKLVPYDPVNTVIRSIMNTFSILHNLSSLLLKWINPFTSTSKQLHKFISLLPSSIAIRRCNTNSFSICNRYRRGCRCVTQCAAGRPWNLFHFFYHTNIQK